MADGDRQVEALIADHDAMRGDDSQPGSRSRIRPRRAPAGVRPTCSRAHIHREEHQLFEQMQAACEPEGLEALGARVAAAHEAAERPQRASS